MGKMITEELIKLVHDLVRQHGAKEIAFQGGVSYNTVVRYTKPNSQITLNFIRKLEQSGYLRLNLINEFKIDHTVCNCIGLKHYKDCKYGK